MTTFEKIKQIRHAVLTSAAESAIYGWDAEFAAKNVRQSFEFLKENIGTVDPKKLTKKQMDELFFGTWRKESDSRLIPLWLFPFLENPPSDNDHRFGYLFESVEPADQAE